jgi:hypothetical protein
MTVRATIAALLAATALLGGCRSTTNSGTVTDASAATTVSTTRSTSTADTPTWGKRYTWPDGLAVEVATPRSCTPSKTAYPQGVKRAVVVTITIVNGTDKPFNAGALSIGSDAQFAGRSAETVADTGGACKSTMLPSGTVLPGKTFTYDEAYAVSPEPGELQLTLQPSIAAEKAVFVGQA